MNKISKMAAVVALAGFTASASAWWGGPFSGWGNDFFSDGGFSFSFSAHGSGHGWGRPYDYYGPYGYPYWGGYVPTTGYPYAVAPALSDEQVAAIEGQQKVYAEQQAQMLQQAVEAQRKFVEQMAQRQTSIGKQVQQGGYDPLSVDPLAGFDPFSMDPLAANDPMTPAHLEDWIAQSDAEYEKAKAESQARREAFQKRVQERRETTQQRSNSYTRWSSAEQQSI